MGTNAFLGFTVCLLENKHRQASGQPSNGSFFENVWTDRISAAWSLARECPEICTRLGWLRLSLDCSRIPPQTFTFFLYHALSDMQGPGTLWAFLKIKMAKLPSSVLSWFLIIFSIMLSYRLLPFKHLWLLFQFLQAWLINTASLALIHGRQFSWLGWSGSSEAQYTMHLPENPEPKCSVITAVTFLMVPARISSPLCTQSSLPIKGGQRKGHFHGVYAASESPRYSGAPGCLSRALER